MAKYKKSALSLGFDIINHLVLVLFLILTIYPFYYILIYTISQPIEAQKGIALLPTHLTLDNYLQIFRLKGILSATVISVLRTVVGTVITVGCCSFLAYLVTKQEMRFRKAVYRFVVVTMYLNAGLIPWYLVMRLYKLNNSFFLYIIPSAIVAYYVVLLKTYIEQLPQSLEESAKLDGAGYLTIFIKIIFPLSTPIIATIAVFASVGQWNTWYDNYFLVQNPQLRTLQLILYDYLNEANAIAQASIEDINRGMAVTELTPTSVRMTITMVATLPILFVYPRMQRYFIKGIMMGAVKG
jgi:putative aldouronate transport system permease protein